MGQGMSQGMGQGMVIMNLLLQQVARFNFGYENAFMSEYRSVSEVPDEKILKSDAEI
jgi:hypothetical protein